MRRLVVAAGLTLALVVSGCGSDGSSAGGPSSTTSTSSTSTSTTTTSAPCRVTGTTEPQENALASVDQLLSDVTTATDGCVDSITFTFRPNPAPAPSYQIEYSDGPFTDPAGREVKPPGSTFLRIRFQPSWIADLSMESAPATYTGPREITPTGMKSVRGLALYDASEGVVAWVVGLDAPRPVAVDASTGKVVVKIS